MRKHQLSEGAGVRAAVDGGRDVRGELPARAAHRRRRHRHRRMEDTRRAGAPSETTPAAAAGWLALAAMRSSMVPMTASTRRCIRAAPAGPHASSPSLSSSQTRPGARTGAALRRISASRAQRKSCCSPITLPGRMIRSHPIAARAVKPWCFIM